jgi:hypothetical protein
VAPSPASSHLVTSEVSEPNLPPNQFEEIELPVEIKKKPNLILDNLSGALKVFDR